MVMDVSPSPQCVGREFVRQYYTLLNKAPDHLHRFYNNSSSFIHGGLDASNRDAPIVIGQKNIHNKIQQLNFRDCHAKISQVDSQATLGAGVVVQVSGELSNAGQPMRRFTQTFVLAAQSPKKYYVHNDIFRYQDLYSEEEMEENGHSEVGDEEMSSQEIDTNASTEQNNQLNTQQTIYYQSNVLTSNAPNILPSFNSTTAATTPQQVTNQTPQQQQQLNGHEEKVALAPETTIPEPQLTQVMEVEEPKAPTPIEVDVFDTANVPVVAEEKPEPVITSNEPKTWSNLLKPGGSVASSTTNANTLVNSATIASTMSPKFPSESNRFDPPLGATGPGLSQKQSLQAQQRGGAGGRERRTSNGTPSGGTQNQQFNDNQQLFLGNIPHSASEDELKALFSRFGTVVDLRILSKQGQPKIHGQRPPPNYGFITYEDAQGVQQCLANTPIYFPENSPDGQKLNVEEKKTRTRGPGETGGRIGSGNNNLGGSGNTQRTLSGSGGQNNRNNGNNSGNLSRGGSNRTPGSNNTGLGQNRGGTVFNSSNNRDRGGQRNGTNTSFNNRRQ